MILDFFQPKNLLYRIEINESTIFYFLWEIIFIVWCCVHKVCEEKRYNKDTFPTWWPLPKLFVWLSCNYKVFPDNFNSCLFTLSNCISLWVMFLVFDVQCAKDENFFFKSWERMHVLLSFYKSIPMEEITFSGRLLRNVSEINHFNTLTNTFPKVKNAIILDFLVLCAKGQINSIKYVSCFMKYNDILFLFYFYFFLQCVCKRTKSFFACLKTKHFLEKLAHRIGTKYFFSHPISRLCQPS